MLFSPENGRSERWWEHPIDGMSLVGGRRLQSCLPLLEIVRVNPKYWGWFPTDDLLRVNNDASRLNIRSCVGIFLLIRAMDKPGRQGRAEFSPRLTLKEGGILVGPWGFGGRVVKSRKTLSDTVQCWAAVMQLVQGYLLQIWGNGARSAHLQKICYFI